MSQEHREEMDLPHESERKWNQEIPFTRDTVKQIYDALAALEKGGASLGGGVTMENLLSRHADELLNVAAGALDRQKEWSSLPGADKTLATLEEVVEKHKVK